MNRPDRVLIGAASRSGKRAAPLVRKLLSEAGIDPSCVILCNRKGDAESIISAMRPESLIWIGGGDGSVRTACQRLVEGKHTLGILPLGTGNALARELDVPLKVEQAVPWLLDTAEPRLIDHGLIDGKPFINMVSVGVTVQIANHIADLPKSRWGILVYVPGIWRAIKTVRPFRLDLKTPVSNFEGEAIQLVAASTRNHGGMFRVTETAAIDDGLLSMYVVGAEVQNELLRLGLAYLRGKQGDLPQVWECNAQSASISFPGPRAVVADGDKIGRKRTWEIGIRPHTLPVLAAKPDAGTL